jgi:hypothetical protein
MRIFPCLLAALALQLTTAAEPKVPKGFFVPESSFSPDKRYGVTVALRGEHGEDAEPKNRLIELKTGRVLAVIKAETAWDHANHQEVMPSRWSKDGALLLWEVDGKWFHDAFVLIKIEDGKVKWQTDILKVAQREILARTKKASPKKYAAAKKDNEGSGSAYPEGFSVDVDVVGGIETPLRVRVVLSSNPKQIEGVPSVYSHMEAIVDSEGRFVVKDFGLGHVPMRNL